MQAHCRRVAALGQEIVKVLGMGEAECDLLRKAALLHHDASVELPPRAADRLLSDVLGRPVVARNREPEWPAECRIASAANGAVSSVGGDDRLFLLAHILRAANVFDEQLEHLAYEDRSCEAILDELQMLAREGFLHPEAVRGLRELRIASEQPGEKPLPRVYPVVLIKALALLNRENVSLNEVEKVAASDAVLTTSLLRVANSCLYTAVEPITTIPRALAHIGIDAAKKVFAAAAVQPLFASATLRGLWEHSIESAAIAERLAEKTDDVDTGTAFVAGLIHDIGRVALESRARSAVTMHRRLADSAACTVFADLAVFGLDHAAMGAELLEQWGLPASLTAGVKLHHRPELTDSRLASLLYLTEYVSGSEEDIPSFVRLRQAMTALSVPSLGELLALDHQSTIAALSLVG